MNGESNQQGSLCSDCRAADNMMLTGIPGQSLFSLMKLLSFQTRIQQFRMTGSSKIQKAQERGEKERGLTQQERKHS
jgi:hypothetical protein